VALMLWPLPLPVWATAIVSPAQGPAYVAGELLVRFVGDATSPRKRLAGVTAKRLGKSSVHLLHLPAGLTVAQALQHYRNDPAVAYAEPNYIVRKALVPDDSRYAEQWAPPLMRLPEAWDITTGDNATVIAIVDTGIDYGHEDLADNVWVNSLEQAGVAGVDDDGNGYVDDIYGYAFGDNYGYPFAAKELGQDGYALASGRDHNDPRDDDEYESHGTHVAGVAAAVGNNGIGVSGVAGQARLMAVKALHGPDGIGTTRDVAMGIRYAADNGARVINLSLSLGGYSRTLADAVDYADRRGVLVITAAGNAGVDLSNSAGMPAALRNANNITVAASTASDRLAGYSSYGRFHVDLAAPGGDGQSNHGGILSTRWSGVGSGLYGSLSGTSMATPQVAGLAALVWAVYPGLDHYRVKARILNGVAPLAGLGTRLITGGRADAFRALTLPELPAIFDLSATRLSAGGRVTIRGVNFGVSEGSASLDGQSLAVVRWQPDGRAVEIQTPSCGLGGRLRVNDDGSGFPIELEQLPVVTIAAPVEVADAPYTLRLEALASDPNGQVVQYEWDTDGKGFRPPQTGAGLVAGFPAAGSYTVRVRVTDDCGYTASAVRAVTIGEPARPAASDSRCFIATAAWGSSLHPRVQALREFRDRYLMGNPLGRALVEGYYRWSPPLADAIRRSPLLRRLTVAILTPLVAGAEWLMSRPAAPARDDGPMPALVPGDPAPLFRRGPFQYPLQQPLANPGGVDVGPQVLQLGGLQSPVAAGVDAGERLQVHVDVEAEAVVTAAATHTQAKGGDLCVADIDAGRAGAALAMNAVVVQQVDDGLFDGVHQRLDAQSTAPQVKQ